MNLTFIQDYSSDVSLDSELMGVPDSGLYWNQGVHPLINIANILAFTPYIDYTFIEWSGTKTYAKFTDDYLVENIVSYNGGIYQSEINTNLDNEPGVDSGWLLTNIESIRIKTFLNTVEKNMISALQLSRKMLENQYVYHVSETVQTLPNDYAGWVVEPKGSDYTTIRINELALQATATGTVDVNVVNQGEVVDTIQLTVDGGKLVFEQVNYSISGFGKFYFVFDAQEVKCDSPYNDPLKYDSFVMYPISGTGSTPESAEYSFGYNGNGLNFNITSYLDISKYITNNIIDFSDMLRTQFEMDMLKLMSTNANNNSEARERNITDNPQTMQLITTESLNTEHLTVANKYKNKLQETRDSINKTFDRSVKSPTRFRSKRRALG